MFIKISSYFGLGLNYSEIPKIFILHVFNLTFKSLNVNYPSLTLLYLMVNLPWSQFRISSLNLKIPLGAEMKK